MRNHFLIFFIYSLLVSCNKTASEPKPIEEPCRVSSIKISNSVNVADNVFTFDKISNSLTLTSKYQGYDMIRTRKYVYDSNNRLIETSGPLEFSGPNISENFKYDLQGRIVEYMNNYQPVGIVISKYIYKDDMVEKYKYRNAVADANLFEIEYYSIDAKQNVTKFEKYVVSSGIQTPINLTTRTYNAQGQLLTINDIYGLSSTVTRYEYDAFNNIKIYFKSLNTKDEYLTEELSNFSSIPEPKRTFKEWQLNLEEPFQFGLKMSNWGTQKVYDTYGKLRYTRNRKYEYDANDFLIRDEISIQYADGSGSKDSCYEWVISCPQ